MDNEEKIKTLEEKNAKLEEELQATKEHLKKYTSPSYKKEYYQNNKGPSEFQRQPSFTCGTLAGVSKTIGNEKVAY